MFGESLLFQINLILVPDSLILQCFVYIYFKYLAFDCIFYVTVYPTCILFLIFFHIFKTEIIFIILFHIFSPEHCDFGVKKWSITRIGCTYQWSSSKTRSSCVSTPITAVTVTVDFAERCLSGKARRRLSLLCCSPVPLTDIQAQHLEPMDVTFGKNICSRTSTSLERNIVSSFYHRLLIYT